MTDGPATERVGNRVRLLMDQSNITTSRQLRSSTEIRERASDADVVSIIELR